MNIIVKEPHKAPYWLDAKNTLASLQKLVDGYIETFTIDDDWTIICNEEGLLRRLPWNCRVLGNGFYGTILFVGVKGPEFTDCPLSIEDLKTLYGVK